MKGRYPKSFKWVGWHPNDLCYVVPIIKSEEKWWEDEDNRGTDNDEITDVPQGFKTWVANNQDRISKAEKRGTLPYFVRDNRERVKQAVKQGKVMAGDYILNPSGAPSGDGGDKIGRFLDIPITKKEAISLLRELAANYDHEEAYVFLPDGRVYHKKGVLNKVAFTTEECKLFEGGVLMHNHPYKSLSEEDVTFAIRYKLREIQVVTSARCCKMILYQNLGYSQTEIKDLIDKGYEHLSASMRKANSIKVDMIRQDMEHYLWKEVVQFTNFRYYVSNLLEKK